MLDTQKNSKETDVDPAPLWNLRGTTAAREQKVKLDFLTPRAPWQGAKSELGMEMLPLGSQEDGGSRGNKRISSTFSPCVWQGKKALRMFSVLGGPLIQAESTVPAGAPPL